MRSEGVELVGKGVASPVDVVGVVVGQVPCWVELVSPSAVVALDMSVGSGDLGSSLKSSTPRLRHSRSRLAWNPESPSTSMAWTSSRKRLALLAVARRQAWAQVHLATGSQAVECSSAGRPCLGALYRLNRFPRYTRRTSSCATMSEGAPSSSNRPPWRMYARSMMSRVSRTL